MNKPSIADIEEAIEFNRDVERARGRDPFEVFTLGNCGFHHLLLEDVFGKENTTAYRAINWPGNKYNVAVHYFSRIPYDKDSVGFFDVTGELIGDWFVKKMQNENTEPVRKLFLDSFHEARYGYDGSSGGRFEECMRMKNNRKLMHLHIAGKRLGMKIDVEKELYKLGDHMI